MKFKFQITSPYGAKESIRDGELHTGVDIGTPMDTPIRTINDGAVIKAIKFGHDKIGNEVVIKDSDGVYHIYGHLDKVNVMEGMKVHEGDLIGLSGQSGIGVTGPHLHYGEEVTGHDGKLHFVDPTSHVDAVINMAGGSELANHSEGVFEQMIWNFLHAVQHVALELIDYSSLLISGILIILSAMGFKKGKQYIWILFALRIILKFVLGGYVA